MTGINVWFARRKTRDYLNDVWAGIVWGLPLALVVSAVTQVLLDIPSGGIFWLTTLVVTVASLRFRDEQRSARVLKLALAVATGILLAGFFIRFGTDAMKPAALGMNLALFAVLLVFARLSFPPRDCQPGPGGSPHGLMTGAAVLVSTNENHYHCCRPGRTVERPAQPSLTGSQF